MITLVAVVFLVTQSNVESESIALGARMRSEFGIPQFSKTEFMGRSDVDAIYGWRHCWANGFNGEECWTVHWNTSGYVGYRLSLESFYKIQSQSKERRDSEALDDVALQKFANAVKSDLEWEARLVEMPESYSSRGVRLQATWYGKPVLSKRLSGSVYWEKITGRYISVVAQLHRPRSVINEGEPMPLEAAETRAQVLYLKQPGDNPAYTPGKLKLGWSVENEAGAARLIYLHERMLESHPIRFAFDAVTGIEVTPPPLR